MNVEKYLEKRRQREAEAFKHRNLCMRCRQPDFSCFCATLRPFDPGIEFAILTHPLEVRRRIATGRMAHMTLKGSYLIPGHNYTDNEEVNRLLARKDVRHFILYPGRNSVNLTENPTYANELLTGAEKACVFVIDGTWATARQTMNQSKNLQDLPRVCFTPPGVSQFRVRKQPAPNCYSTIEAIHHFLDLVGGVDLKNRPPQAHDVLLESFRFLVENQLNLIKNASNPRRESGKSRWRFRRPRNRKGEEGSQPTQVE